MSTERSSSAVRNLRSLFENKASENSPDTRGRSPGVLSRRDDNKSPSPLPPRTSRIRASFVAVEPRFNMATAADELSSNIADVTENTASELRRESSKGARRASFSDNKDGVAAGALRETISTEQARRDEDSTVRETIPESAIESAAPTPLVEVDQQLRTAKTDKPAVKPDKSVTGAEEEPAAMTPTDPASVEAVSGGKSQAPGAEDLRKSEVKKTNKTSPAVTRATANGKPSGITTKEVNKSASSSLKSPISQPKTPLSPVSTGASPKSTTTTQAKKTSRASLTAPTAASVARAAAAEKEKAAGSGKPAAPKPKPREVTKPVDVSRLTAPTAASRAKYEPATSAPAIPKPTTVKPKITTSRPTPRQSLARPESRGSTRRPTGPVDSSFLDRMTRPTAASSNKTQKVEQTPPKQLSQRTKANGHPKGVKTASKDAVVEPFGDTTAIDEPAQEEAVEHIPEQVVLDSAKEAPAEVIPEPVAEEAVEIDTQVPSTNGHASAHKAMAQEETTTSSSAKEGEGVLS